MAGRSRLEKERSVDGLDQRADLTTAIAADDNDVDSVFLLFCFAETSIDLFSPFSLLLSSPH
jgi:hypothetical protein